MRSSRLPLRAVSTEDALPDTEETLVITRADLGAA
jgi:hypothetical protein